MGWLLEKKLGLTTCWLDMIAEQEHLGELVDDYAKRAESRQKGDR